MSFAFVGFRLEVERCQHSAEQIYQALKVDLAGYTLRDHGQGILDTQDYSTAVYWIEVRHLAYWLEIDVYLPPAETRIVVRSWGKAPNQAATDYQAFARMVAQEVFCALERRGFTVQWVYP